MDAGYHFTPLTGPAVARLMPLLTETFGRRDFSPEWLKGKYAGSFQGIEGFSCVAMTESGEAAASLGVLPWPVRYGNRVEIAGQLVDAATHSQHRRRGLFMRLAEMVRTRSEAAGISFLFAFVQPQGGSHTGFVRHLGYRQIDELVEYRWPIRSLPVERIAFGAPTLRRAYGRYAERVMRTSAAVEPILENSLAGEGFAATDRHRAFYLYKSFGGSRVVDTPGGRAWLKVHRGLFVGDLEAPSVDGLDKTVAALAALGKRLGVHQLLFQASKDTHFTPWLSQRRPALPSQAIVYQSLSSQIPAEKLRFTLGDLDNF